MSELNPKSPELPSAIDPEPLGVPDAPPPYKEIDAQSELVPAKSKPNYETAKPAAPRPKKKRKPKAEDEKGPEVDPKAQFSRVNRELERTEAPEYHLVITRPVVCADTASTPSEEIVRHNINTFLVRLYKKCGHDYSPLRFSEFKLEQGPVDEDGNVKDELLIRLAPIDEGTTVTDHIGSFVKCLFNTESQDVVSSISELRILGISPVKGTAIQRQWDLELLQDIGIMCQFFKVVEDLGEQKNRANNLKKEIADNESRRILSFAIALGIDLVGRMCWIPERLLRLVFGDGAIPRDEECEREIQRRAEEVLTNIAQSRTSREDMEECKRRAARSMDECCKAIDAVVATTDLMTRPSSDQETYQFLNALTSCIRWAADALTCDVDMLRAFLQESQEHKKRLEAQRAMFFGRLGNVLVESAISGGIMMLRGDDIAESIRYAYANWAGMDWWSICKAALPFAVPVLRWTLSEITTLYASHEDYVVKKGLETALNAAVTLQEVWYVSTWTYVFVTQTEERNGIRIFSDDTVMKLWRLYGSKAEEVSGVEDEVERSDDAIDSENIRTLGMVLERNKLRLKKNHEKLKAAVAEFRTIHNV
ncbi:uncharacterized protein DFL_003306 [Arthrobotrys flagrans]|uniref:Uncharacterized protein n=1 Tax=Arthrobotrys flagrans TaxID=97331 RepID=A0A437A1N0_ARTFL|nr:hypothetical protein DFL_003306 [Arthrobotrys flagrans]